MRESNTFLLFITKISYNYLVGIMERISKVISNSGYTSRRNADKLISEGRVVVNGEKALLGQKISNSSFNDDNVEIIEKLKGLVN